MPPHRVAITFEPPPVRPVLPVERFVGEGLPEPPEYVLVAHEAIHRVPELFPDGAMDTPETDRRQLLEMVLATLPFLEPSPVLRDFVPGFYGVGGVEGHPEKDAPRVGVVLGDRAFEPAQGAAKAVTETGSIVQPPSFALKESHVRDPSIMLVASSIPERFVSRAATGKGQRQPRREERQSPLRCDAMEVDRPGARPRSPVVSGCIRIGTEAPPRCSWCCTSARFRPSRRCRGS